MLLAPAWVLILAVVAALCLAIQGRPVFFLQYRTGKDEKLFRIVKFRTMRVHDSRLSTEKDITFLGRFLRRFSLDELPELLNVIQGTMSLVGPRPLLPEYVQIYTAAERTRHRVKPGITGLAQINGRNEISWRKKLAYDIAYVETRSLTLDFKILLKTFPLVFSGKGVEADAGGLVSSLSCERRSSR